MSADNWSICPRCFDIEKDKSDEERQAVMALYGKIAVDAFDARPRAIYTPDASDFETFREDYEFYGADEGEVRSGLQRSVYQVRPDRRAQGVQAVLARRERTMTALSLRAKTESALPYPVVKTEEPCAGCGKPIVPGSLYKPGGKPRHFGC